MGAANVAALGTHAGVGHQAGDVGARARQVFDELLTGLDVRHGAAAAGTAAQGNRQVVVNLRGLFAIGGGMSRFASRLLVLFRRLAVFVLAAYRLFLVEPLHILVAFLYFVVV